MSATIVKIEELDGPTTPIREVLNLWRVDLRGLGYNKHSRTAFTMHVASRSSNERDVVKELRNRFEPKWWDDNIVTGLEEIGNLHMIDGIPLYESD